MFHRRLFEYYLDEFGNLYVSYAFKTFVSLDYAFACVAFEQIVEIIAKVVSFRVVLRNFIYRRADICFEVFSAFCDCYDISDQYVAKISSDERQFLHALFAERQLRDIPKTYVFEVVVD